jgi:hypothetical protein
MQLEKIRRIREDESGAGLLCSRPALQVDLNAGAEQILFLETAFCLHDEQCSPDQNHCHSAAACAYNRLTSSQKLMIR